MIPNGVMRIVSRLQRLDRNKALFIILDITRGFDREHIAYLVAHQISIWKLLPEPLNYAAIQWLFSYLYLRDLSVEEQLSLVVEARPDLREIVDTEVGRQWLQGLFQW